MQRYAPIPAGLILAAALVGTAFLAGRGATRPAPPRASSHAPAAPAPPPSAEPDSPEADADVTAGLELDLTEPQDLALDAGISADLPAGAPKTVSFGVILFHYAGAQMAPAGARTKEEARRLAKEVAQAAQADFDSAVKRGDRGSTTNAGKIPRGVLESSVEYVLFTLKKGEVHPEPLETPRGFWIVRRND